MNFTRAIICVTAVLASGCASITTLSQETSRQPEPALAAANGDDNTALSKQDATIQDSAFSTQTATEQQWNLPDKTVPEQTAQTGTIGNPQLSELSGMVASRSTTGVIFAINDSGNQPTLFAMSETGQHLRSWRVDADNRDWEDMAWAVLDNVHYLVIGDTGDNLKVHKQARLLFIKEPTVQTPDTETLTPDIEINFTYDDGPRNVEAFAIDNNQVFLISKEPVTDAGPSPSHLYALDIPTQATEQLQKAMKLATLPNPATNFESRMVAALTGVDLNHPTAMDIDPVSNTAYILTYRHVLSVRKGENQRWADALAARPKKIHNHRLEQAEALAIAPGRAVWFSSENQSAPLWAIPIRPPL